MVGEEDGAKGGGIGGRGGWGSNERAMVGWTWDGDAGQGGMDSGW